MARFSRSCSTTPTHLRNAAAAATFAHMLIARRVLSARSITSNHRFHAPASSRDASLARAPVTFCDTTTYSAHWFHADASSRSISRARAPSSLARFSCLWASAAFQAAKAQARVPSDHMLTALFVFRASSQYSVHRFQFFASSLWMIRRRNAFPFSSMARWRTDCATACRHTPNLYFFVLRM